jgi:hypothetical protein
MTMHQTLTVGMIVWPLLVIFAAFAVLVILAFVASIFADGFKH